MALSDPGQPRTATAPGRRVLSVSALNALAREVLEQHFPMVWVEGEISNLSRPASGHLYFSLKDERCQVRCAMFRSANRRLLFAPADGMQVLAHARVSLYAERGAFQLIVEFLEESGEGALRRAFDALKRRLLTEGVFDAARKRPLPFIPRRIGVLSSPSGAALQDILSVLARRFPAVPVLVHPIPVQGRGAGTEIAAAIALAAERGDCDVLVLARGGGSLEDLWAFNEEAVARAIAECTIPIVTGIGHETDFTIADFVADVRAPTPSVAAEMVVPDRIEMRQRVAALSGRARERWQSRLDEARAKLAWLERRLVHPRRRLEGMTQRSDELRVRTERAMRAGISARSARLAVLEARLGRYHPGAALSAQNARCTQLMRRLATSARQQITAHRARLEGLVRTLSGVGPLHTLARGYAVVVRSDTGRVIRDSAGVAPGDRVTALLARGSLRSIVESAGAPGAWPASLRSLEPDRGEHHHQHGDEDGESDQHPDEGPGGGPG